MSAAININCNASANLFSGANVPFVPPAGALEGSEGTVLTGSDDVQITGSN